MKIFNRYLSGIAIIAGVSLAVYYFIRVLFFLSVDYGSIDRIFAVLLLLGETYMIVHAFGYVLAVFRLGSGKDLYEFVEKPSRTLPQVAVAVVARHEPANVLEQTFVTLGNLEYVNKKLYLLDGSDEESFIKADQALCEKYGINYFHPNKRAKTKGATVNQFLKSIQEEYVALLDADQNPMPDFLQKVVAIAESDEKIAFVQTPQFYSNVDVSPIAKGAAMQQAVFFEGTCESKGLTNSMFFCGTNALFRR
ncbi:glycosyltransferase, partial [Patescibacteria group bacterium]